MKPKEILELSEFCEEIGTAKHRLSDFMYVIMNETDLTKTKRFIEMMYAQMKDHKRQNQ